MRALILRLIVASGLATLPITAFGQTDSFEYLGLKPGMTVDQAEKVVETNKLGTANIWRAPAFEQKIAIARGQRVPAGSYQGVQRLRADGGRQQIDVAFVTLPSGPVAAKVVIEVYSDLAEETLRQRLAADYGQPSRQTDREWLWGDSAALEYARTKPYLEVRLRPASLSAKKPIATIVIVDPSLEKSAKDAFEQESRR